MEGTVSLLPEDPTLPSPWKALEDNDTGYVYYWNPETRCTQWNKPSPPGGRKKRRHRRKRKSAVIANGADQLNGGSRTSLMAGLNGNHVSAAGAMSMQESTVAGVSVPQAAQVAATMATPLGSKLDTSTSAVLPSDGADNGEFTKVVKITGADGHLGIRGEYHLKADLYDGFPRYEKIGVDPKKHKERRFLTHFSVGPGRWVLSDWEEFLLLGPVAEKQAGPKSPDKFQGKYEVCKDVGFRCKGVVKIKVTPVKDESNVAPSSSSGQLPRQAPSNVATSSSSAKQSPTPVQNHEPGQVVDEDARAVRKRFYKQMNDAIQDGTFEESDGSDEDISFDLPWAGQKKLCEQCGKKGRFKCKRCNFTYYCSEAHQAAHHAKHQKVCDQLDGVKLTCQMEDMLRWVGPPDSDAECEKDHFKTSAFDLRCLLECGKRFGQPGSFKDAMQDDDDDDDDAIDPFDDDLIMSQFGMSAFDFRSLDGSRYTMDQRYQGSYEDAMNAIDFCPDADDPRFW